MYGTGGFAYGAGGGRQFGLPNSSTNDFRTGWTAGGGIEAALAGNWTAKVEYLHVDLGRVNCGALTCALPGRVGFHADEVRAGLNYRF